MISYCANRFDSGVEPLVVHGEGASVIYALDGSGSWGTGVEAAAWFRDWIAKEGGDSITSPQTVTELLAAGIHALPSAIVGDQSGGISDDDFHWSFSIAVAILQNECVQVGASGSIAAAVIRSRGFERLFVPIRLVDELVSRGTISRAEAENHQCRRMCCGPFFGIDNNPELQWCDPVSLYDCDRVVLADAALPRFLEKYDFMFNTFTTATQLRDAIEKYGGSSTPTVILDYRANAS